MLFREGLTAFSNGATPGSISGNPCSNNCPTEFIEHLNYFSFLTLCQNFACFIDFLTQVAAIWLVYSNKKFRNGSFFTLLMVLAISVIIRSLTSLIVNIILSIAHRGLPIFNLSLSIWLYVDYCTGYFSNILIFFMSLNRCLCFVKRHWGEAIFEGKRICLPILFSVVLSVASAIVSIRSSGVRRLVIDGAGFVDWGDPEGLKMLFTRLYHIFPIGSAICYIILFYYLRNKKQELQSRNSSNRSQNNKGEQNVFIQLLITVIFYGIMALIFEILYFLDRISGISMEITLIAIVNIVNYLPEISLPFLIILNNFRPIRRVSVMVAGSQTQSQVSGRRK